MLALMLRKEFVRQVNPQKKPQPEQDEAHHAQDEGDLEVAQAAKILSALVDSGHI